MPNPQIIEIRFGGESAEYLSIKVAGRAYHRSTDYWDGNWLHVLVGFQLGKFNGAIPGLFRAEELARFEADLQTFYKSLTGIVSFATMEQWFDLHITANKLGHVGLSGKMSDNLGYTGNRLEFAMNMDQTFLAATLKQLQTVTKAFPVVGKP